MEGVAQSDATDWWLDPRQVEGHVLGVFEGGGAKGVLYVAGLRALLRQKLWFSAVAGSSAGAITAALIAAGLTPEEMDRHMRDGLDALDPPTTWSGLRRVTKAVGFLDRDSLLTWLRNILRAKCQIEEGQDGPSFEQLFQRTNIDLFVVSVDLTTSRLAVFNRKLSPICDVAEAVVASATIPVALEPTRLSSLDEQGQARPGSLRYFADGGIASNFPTFVFRDDAFRAYAGLDPVGDEPLVGFLLDESRGESEPSRPYLDGRFEGTYHDWMQAHSNDRRYRTPRFRRRRTDDAARGRRRSRRLATLLQTALFGLLAALGTVVSSPGWPGEWPPPPQPRERRANLLLKSFRRWVSVAPAYFVLGVATYTAAFWYGMTRAFGEWAGSAGNGAQSVWSYISWLVIAGVMVVAVLVWFMGLFSMAFMRITYRTTSLYGSFFVRTFLNTPAAPPWAGRGPNERLVRLEVPEWITTMRVRDRSLLRGFLAETEDEALAQLQGVKGRPIHRADQG